MQKPIELLEELHSTPNNPLTIDSIIIELSILNRSGHSDSIIDALVIELAILKHSNSDNATSIRRFLTHLINTYLTEID